MPAMMIMMVMMMVVVMMVMIVVVWRCSYISSEEQTRTAS
jgi:hypothetical protein